MELLSKFFRYPPAERGLLLRAGVMMLGVKGGLAVLPLGRLMRLVRSTRPSRPVRIHSLRTIHHAVQAAGRRVPGARCLERSLVAQHLLLRMGYSAELKLGVKKDTGKRIHAHAWVECEGAVVFDSDQSSQSFSSFPNLST